MVTTRRTAFIAVVTLFAASSFARAQVLYSEGFETYTSGNVLPPQGGWIDFGGSQTIIVSSTQAHTGLNSMRLSEGTDTQGGTTTGYGSDIYRNFVGAPISSGIVNLRFFQFVQTGVDSVSHMYFSTKAMDGSAAGFQAGLWLLSSSGTGGAVVPGTSLIATRGATDTPLAAPVAQVFGAWAEHNLTVNLGTNTFSYSYNGAPVITSAVWDTVPADGISFGGINFWMQNGNANAVNNFVFFDDFTLTQVPEPSSIALTGIGLAGAAWWRRRRRR